MDNTKWKMVPVERTYDMRVKALMAFNRAQRDGKDRDDALDSAFQAMLDNAPQPTSSSGEREAFVKWLSGTYPDIYPVEDAERRWSQEHISALAWEARAALAPSPSASGERVKPVNPDVLPILSKIGASGSGQPFSVRWAAMEAVRVLSAPSPGIDAAEPVAWLTSDGKMLVFADNISKGRAQHSGMTPLYAAPPAAQPSADNAQFPFYELRFIMRVLSHQGSAPKEDWQTAYGMARDIFVRWSKERKAAEPHPPSRACMCDACKPSFDNGSDDPAQRYDIARQVPGPSAEWLSEAERLVDFYAESFSKPTDSGKCRQRLASLLAHLRTKP